MLHQRMCAVLAGSCLALPGCVATSAARAAAAADRAGRVADADALAQRAARRDAENDKAAFLLRADDELGALEARAGLLVMAAPRSGLAPAPPQTALADALQAARGKLAKLREADLDHWRERRLAVEDALAAAQADFDTTVHGLAH